MNRLTLAAGSLALCAAGCTASSAQPPLPQQTAPLLAFADSCLPPPLALLRGAATVPYAAPPASTTLFLNFEGATILQAEASSAWEGRSFLCGATIPPFDHRPYGDDRSVVLEQILQRVAQLFAPYALTVVAQRPLWPPFDMALIGGDAALCGLSSGLAGYGPLDCDNAIAGEIAFIFSQSLTNLDLLAIVIAHELGHAYGLLHTLEPCDVMSNFYCPLEDKGFFDQPSALAPDHLGRCGLQEQNSHQSLLAVLGAGGTPGDGARDAGLLAADVSSSPAGDSDLAGGGDSWVHPADGPAPGEESPYGSRGCQVFRFELPWSSAFLVPLLYLWVWRRQRRSANGGETKHGHPR